MLLQKPAHVEVDLLEENGVLVVEPHEHLLRVEHWGTKHSRAATATSEATTAATAVAKTASSAKTTAIGTKSASAKAAAASTTAVLPTPSVHGRAGKGRGHVIVVVHAVDAAEI